MEETLKNVRTVKRFTIHGRGESFIYLYDRVEQTCLSHMCHVSVTFSLQHRPLHSRCVPDFAWKSTPANSPSWSGDARGGEGADAAPRAGPSAAPDSERRRLSSRWGAPRAARRAGSCRRSLLPLPPPPPPPAVEMAHCSGAARLTAPVPVPHLSVAAGARQPLQRRWRQWWCPRQAAAAVRQHEGGKAARLPVPARAKHLGEAARPGGMSMRLRRPAAALAPNPPPPPRHPLRPACRDGSLPESGGGRPQRGMGRRAEHCSARRPWQHPRAAAWPVGSSQSSRWRRLRRRSAAATC